MARKPSAITRSPSGTREAMKQLRETIRDAKVELRSLRQANSAAKKEVALATRLQARAQKAFEKKSLAIERLVAKLPDRGVTSQAQQE